MALSRPPESPLLDALLGALYTADLDRATELLAAGADLNVRVGFDTLLSQVISAIRSEHRLPVVRFMLAHGADPRLLGDNGLGPLFAAVYVLDTEVIRLLLDHGADPNREHNGDGEPLYDWAVSDYRDEVFNVHLPEPPTKADRANADTWLAYLDRLAVKYGKWRPDHLILFRSRGALTWKEQDALKGSLPSS